jgi:hypothetical protein
MGQPQDDPESAAKSTVAPDTAAAVVECGTGAAANDDRGAVGKVRVAFSVGLGALGGLTLGGLTLGTGPDRRAAVS